MPSRPPAYPSPRPGTRPTRGRRRSTKKTTSTSNSSRVGIKKLRRVPDKSGRSPCSVTKATVGPRSRSGQNHCAGASTARRSGLWRLRVAAGGASSNSCLWGRRRDPTKVLFFLGAGVTLTLPLPRATSLTCRVRGAAVRTRRYNRNQSASSQMRPCPIGIPGVAVVGQNCTGGGPNRPCSWRATPSAHGPHRRVIAFARTCCTAWSQRDDLAQGAVHLIGTLRPPGH